MSIPKRLSPAFTIAAAALVGAAVLTGCGSEVGSGADTDTLKGTTISTEVFPGAGPQNSTTISASALEAGKDYTDSNDAALIVEGNLPPDVSISVPNGTLTIKGNVVDGDKLDAEAPIVTDTYSCYTYGYTINGKYEYGYVINGCTDTLGLRFNGPESILHIFGAVSPKSQLTSNGGITVNGQSVANPNKLNLAPANS